MHVVCSVLLVLAHVVVGKRGLAWPWFNENSVLDPERLVSSQVVWMYNWETWRPSKTQNLNWMGTQRCLDCDSSPINQLQARAADQGWNTVLTLNEPDVMGVSPSQAAAWYIQYINPLNIKKAAPAVTSSQASGQGLDWLNQFFSCCAGSCFVDYINIHWYGASFNDFQAHVEATHLKFPNLPIIISEFALQSPATQVDQEAFMKQAVPYLDNTPFVEYYAFFIASSPTLFAYNDPAGTAFAGNASTLYDDFGNPSPLGSFYVSL
ncbi:glycoside hydrolase family 128 protein [Ceratobasidium sp. AG-Ba]|nr:glycoside hydrolase family 128 protein [Ceratobasidium sp. AG-Ba]